MEYSHRVPEIGSHVAADNLCHVAAGKIGGKMPPISPIWMTFADRDEPRGRVQIGHLPRIPQCYHLPQTHQNVIDVSMAAVSHVSAMSDLPGTGQGAHKNHREDASEGGTEGVSGRGAMPAYAEA